MATSSNWPAIRQAAIQVAAERVLLDKTTNAATRAQAKADLLGGAEAEVDSFVRSLSLSELMAMAEVLRASDERATEAAATSILDNPERIAPTGMPTIDESMVLRAELAIARRNDVRRDELLVALIELLPPEDRQRDVSEL